MNDGRARFVTRGFQREESHGESFGGSNRFGQVEFRIRKENPNS